MRYAECSIVSEPAPRHPCRVVCRTETHIDGRARSDLQTLTRSTMNKLSTTTVALALALAGNVALADDSSMSRFGGESYVAFQAAQAAANAAAAPERKLLVADDNGMSRFNGDSYAAFERARLAAPAVTVSIREANKAIAQAHRQVPPRATRGRTPVDPFKDETA
jgi:hypothetical protein